MKQSKWMPTRKELPKKERYWKDTGCLYFGKGGSLLVREKPQKANSKHQKPLNIQKEEMKKTTKGSCCVILESHHELLKYDPERLSTEFIKKMSRCVCDEAE